MVKKTKILLQKKGCFCYLYPIPTKISSKLFGSLSYNHKTYLRGRDARLARQAGQNPWRITQVKMFSVDASSNLKFPAGYRPLVETILKEAGFETVYRDLEPHPKPQVFEPNFDAIFSRFDLRHKQDEILLAIASNERGCIECAPGYGKSFLIKLLALLFPKAKIDVIIPGLDLLEQVYMDLSSEIPSVGKVTGSKVRETDVTVISSRSLHKISKEADIVLADEVHLLATPETMKHFWEYRKARAYGFSASLERSDGQSFAATGFFGPTITNVEYQESQEHGMVVPVEVWWAGTEEPENTLDVDLSNMPDTVVERLCIWNNKKRNELIQKAARCFDEKTQVLVTVKTLEHAIYLNALLPDFSLVYNQSSMTPDRYEKFVRAGLIDPSKFEPMSMAKRLQYKHDFEKMKLKKVIATTVWNQGVDFQNLSVVIRADAATSRQRSIQIPGRVTRISQGVEKLCGIVVDFADRFHPSFKKKALARRKVYDEKGWTQVSWRVG